MKGPADASGPSPFEARWRGHLRVTDMQGPARRSPIMAPPLQPPSLPASWRGIDRFAGGGFVRVDGDELDVAVVVERELAERRQLADLPAHLVEREGAVERLELARQAEHRVAQLHLVER